MRSRLNTPTIPARFVALGADGESKQLVTKANYENRHANCCPANALFRRGVMGLPVCAADGMWLFPSFSCHRRELFLPLLASGECPHAENEKVALQLEVLWGKAKSTDRFRKKKRKCGKRNADSHTAVWWQVFVSEKPMMHIYINKNIKILQNTSFIVQAGIGYL